MTLAGRSAQQHCDHLAASTSGTLFPKVGVVYGGVILSNDVWSDGNCDGLTPPNRRNIRAKSRLPTRRARPR